MLFLKLEPQDVGIIMRALGAMPLSESMQTFLRVQQQLAEQQARQAAPPKPPEGDKPAPNGEADKPAAVN